MYNGLKPYYCNYSMLSNYSTLSDYTILSELVYKRDIIVNKKKTFEIKLKELSNELIIFENAINKLCEHDWITDYVDKPNGEGSEMIIYCNFCNSVK